MTPVKHKWSRYGVPFDTAFSGFTESELIQHGWEQGRPDGFMVSILYDTGQACTFKRKAKKEPNDE